MDAVKDRSEYMKEWRAKKKADTAFVEKRKEYLKEWRKANAAKCADYMKVYRLTHPEYTEKEKLRLTALYKKSRPVEEPEEL